MQKPNINNITEKLGVRSSEFLEKNEFHVVQNKDHTDDILDDYRFVRKNYWYAVQVSINLINDILRDDDIFKKAKSLNLVLGAVNDSLKGLMEAHEKLSSLLDGKIDDYDLKERDRKNKICATVTEIVEAHEAIKRSRMNSKEP